MDRRSKSSGITICDLNDALAEAHITPQPKESRKYWAIKRQIAWEHRRKILEGQAKARAEGKRIGRPPDISMGATIGRMRQQGKTWQWIAKYYHRPMSTVFRHYDMYMRELGLPRASRQRLK